MPTGYLKPSDSDSLDSWALLLMRLVNFAHKTSFSCLLTKRVSRNEFFPSTYETTAHKTVFWFAHETSHERLSTPAHESTIHETSAHETSFKLNRKSTILHQKFNKLNFSFEFIHETSFSLCSLNECWQNEFFALLTKQVLMKRVLTSAHETSLKLVTKFTI